MSHGRIMKRLRRDEKGATAIEFAIVALPFFILMFGVIEYGLLMLTNVAVEAATIQVSRNASLGTITPGCADRVCEVKRLVQKKTAGLVRAESVLVNATVVSGATTTTPPTPDICIDDPNNPYPATCTAWDENGGSPAYDPPASLGCASLGVAGDIVEIRVTYLWRVLFPIFRSHFGKNGVVTISASTVIRNEPFPGAC